MNHQQLTMLSNFVVSGGPDVAAAFGEMLAEREQLRAAAETFKDNALDVGGELEHVKAERDRLRGAMVPMLGAFKALEQYLLAVRAGEAPAEAATAVIAAGVDAMKRAVELDWTLDAHVPDLLDRISELTGRLARAEFALGADGPITGDGLPAAVSAVMADRDRMRAVVEAACSELDEIAYRSGYGSIGVVVERLIDQLGLAYPLDVDRERT